MSVPPLILSGSLISGGSKAVRLGHVYAYFYTPYLWLENRIANAYDPPKWDLIHEAHSHRYRVAEPRLSTLAVVDALVIGVNRVHVPKFCPSPQATLQLSA